MSNYDIYNVTHMNALWHWLIHRCGMTHWYVWHDSFIRVPWYDMS